MKRKDRFLPLEDLKQMALALTRGSAVCVVMARTKEGQSFMCGNGPKSELEEMIREGLDQIVLGQTHADDAPEAPSEEPCGPSRLILP